MVSACHVDGFSGPWRSEDEHFEDTSFVIASNKLAEVKDGCIQRDRNVRFRALFIEEDIEKFQKLKSQAAKITDIEAKTLPGSFEELIPDIVEFIGNSFSLIFIDPTGWQGFALDKIRPLLNLRGEIVINFMFNDINRFFEDSRPGIANSFASLFGGADWYQEYLGLTDLGWSREESLLEVYRKRLKRVGDFKFVTSTIVLNPLRDRTYFHLVYATRHLKGLIEFKKIERKLVSVQDNIRSLAKQSKKILESGQFELFDAKQLSTKALSFEQIKIRNLTRASKSVVEMLKAKRSVSFEELQGRALEWPLVWDEDLQQIIEELGADGKVKVLSMGSKERTIKTKHTIVWTG